MILNHQQCILCGNQKFKHLFDVVKYPVLRCEACHLQFLSPQPGDERLAEIYSKDYFLPVDDEQINFLKRATAKGYIERIQRAQSTRPDRKLLEIGCGKGNFLVEAKAQGFQVSGIEYSNTFVAEANEKLGEKSVSCGELDSAEYRGAKFDVIVASDVVEHVRNPVDFVKRIADLLEADGLFFCTLPSLNSWSAKLMGKSWVEYKEEHLYYFTPDNFARLLKSVGFNTIELEGNKKVLNLDYIIAHMERYRIPGWTTLLTSMKKFIPGFALRQPFEIVASGMTAIARF